MSYNEAIEDNIFQDKDQRGFNRYHIPCRVCGETIINWSYTRGRKYTCMDCKRELSKLEFESKCLTNIDKKEEKLKVALKRIGKITNMANYNKAIHIVRQGFDKSLWYQSTEEIMVALELVKKDIKVHHQVRVFDYRVDFVLPDLKVALEIDGAIYHKDNKKETIRDEIITNKLGKGYELIHISTDNINKNITKLLPAIRAVLRNRKKSSSVFT